MSTLVFNTGDLFRFTVIKYLTANPDRKWSNNYEMRAKVDGVTSDLTAVGMDLVDFERTITYDLAMFDRVRISTWEPDSTPYDPSVFISLPLAAAGTKASAGGQLLALNVCLDIGRVPLTGRFGHLYYRAALSEAMVVSPAGKWVLNDIASVDDSIQVALDSSTVDEYIDGTSSTFEMVMVGQTEGSARQIAALTARGVATVPFDHAWFNRTTTP